MNSKDDVPLICTAEEAAKYGFFEEDATTLEEVLAASQELKEKE